MSLLDDFVKAIKRANSRKVASLLKNDSVDVNARLPCRNNPPPLVLAATRGHVEIVEMLLKAGARIDDTDERGRTACHAAVLACSDDVMAVLLAHQPNLEISSERHKTPLKCSLRCLTWRISVMLINAGASLDGVRRTRLCESGSLAAIQALRNRGVAVNLVGILCTLLRLGLSGQPIVTQL